MIKTSARGCFRLFSFVCLAALLAACGSGGSKKETSASSGPRLPVMESTYKPKADTNLSGFSVSVPDPVANDQWPTNGGSIDHSPGNSALAKVPEQIWSATIGTGSGRSYKLLGSPVASGDEAFAMDSIGRVAAFSLKDGERLWRVETTPPSRDGEAMGGGIAYDNGIVYASTGFGEVVALNAQNGGVIWRSAVGKPIRSAPTVAEGRVFVVNIENVTTAIDSKTGRIVWQHSGIAESAALMGASSPAVHGDTLVVAYSSGELFGLRVQNGRVVWGEVLAVPTQKGALPAIAHIRGLPVIDDGRVYAVSHSGRMIAIEERTGNRVWEADIGGSNTPCAVGNAVYVLSNDNELMALTRDGGRIAWVTELQKHMKPSDRDSKRITWHGPVMAGGRLWLTNSLGYMAAFSPEDGSVLVDKEVAEPFFLPPVVAGRTMLLLSDDGKLRAFR